MTRTILIILLITSCISSIKAQGYYERVDSADFYIARQRWDDAERTLKDALRLQPGNILNAMLLSNLGYVQHSQGKLQDAIESYSIGISMTPNSLILRKNRADAYIESDMIDKAYEDLTNCINIDPNDTDCRNKHAFIALQMGELDIAKNDFLTILNNNPSATEGLLGMTIWADYSNDFTTAIEYATQLLDKQKSAENYSTRALLYIKVNNLPAADDDVREGLNIDNRYGDLYLLRAYLHKLRYRYKEAEIDKKIAIDYNADAQLVQSLFP